MPSSSRKLNVLVPLLLLALLVIAPTASASDNRSGDTTERLYYGTPVQQDITTFSGEVSEPGTGPSLTGCTIQGGTGNPTLARTAWYRIVGTGGAITLSTAGSTNSAAVAAAPTLDTVLAIYAVGGTTPLACSDDVSSLTDRTSAIANFATSPGVTYEVQIGTTVTPSCGTGCFMRLAVTNPLSPPGDQRAGAVALTSSLTPNNTFASEEPGEALTCPNQGTNHNLTRTFGKTIWLKYHATDTGTATFRSGGGVDTVEAVYAGDSPTYIACNDDDGGGIFTSKVAIPVTTGSDYFVQVGGFSSAFGGFSASVDFSPNHDLDGDGSAGSAFGGPDCDDANAAVHPGATDVPHDGIDQDCSGKDASYPKLASTSHSDFALAKGGFTTFSALYLSNVPAAAKVVMSCTSAKSTKSHKIAKAHRCAFKKQTITVGKATHKLSLFTFFKQRKLAPGTKVHIQETLSGAIGLDLTLTTRSGKSPKQVTRCLPVGSGKPQKSCPV